MRSPRRSQPRVERVIVEEIGPALLVHSAGDPAVALTAMTSALPPEPGRVAIVTAPSVTARSDFLHLVGQLIGHRLRGKHVGVRLVALGSAAARLAGESQWRALSDGLGRELVAPLGSLTVGADGTVAAAASSGVGGGWVTYAPGAPQHYEPAWFPAPAWAKDLPPETAEVSAYGAAAAYPVPAGYWILPRGVTPGRAGAASTIAPDPTVATVFLGGFGELSLALDDVALSLAALPMPFRYRLVLLPGALRTPADAVNLREYCAPSVQIIAAAPVWSGGSTWSLALPGRPASGQLDRGSLPTGVQTAAGWSFVTGSEPVGVVPTPAGFVVEVNTDATGFQVYGTSVTADKLADQIAMVCSPRRTVVVVAHGTPPAGHVADALFGVLARALGAVVIAADAEVSMSRTGLLHTSGHFWSWRAPPAEPGTGPHVRACATLGDTIPPPLSTAVANAAELDPPGQPYPRRDYARRVAAVAPDGELRPGALAEVAVGGVVVAVSAVGVRAQVRLAPPARSRWLAPDAPDPDAVLPAVLGEDGQRRLFLDLATVPGVLTVTGPLPRCRRFAHGIATRLSGHGCQVTVVGGALDTVIAPGWHRQPDFPEIDAADAGRGIVITEGLRGAALARARGLSGRTEGRYVAVVIGEVLRSRWSISVEGSG